MGKETNVISNGRGNESDLLTEFPKYAALATLQNKPTSTTPVNILIWAIIFFKVSALLPLQKEKTPTKYGSTICSPPNGASIMKLPLSVTTGPAAGPDLSADRRL
jgi:hypothetical protein